eukprot:CAMPEP_0174368120 /NCGR_PEP_ID=MMETSP0811_2-20130205/87889_1 /TAXON_ID=73025 ORGANISM="Eutreptiella gymnastica-like, Strain CCMP1594" /NCGR_SAMPLE_ID=MMETSP0811_2 /ASSEMBLY_ACC=CAM_ASM_000667 /LENGTH=85 /DNA_ID=CAMNT_0015511321 /DNA_START=436 /DNA_END=693 /DNA_ORIENTATION=+
MSGLKAHPTVDSLQTSPKRKRAGDTAVPVCLYVCPGGPRHGISVCPLPHVGHACKEEGAGRLHNDATRGVLRQVGRSGVCQCCML